MKRHYMLTLLALFVLAMGAVGWVRTESIMPLVINGLLALVTLWIALRVRRGSRRDIVLAVIWTGLNVLLYTYLTVMPVAAHNPGREGSKYIFGSMALATVIVFFRLAGALGRDRKLPKR